MEVQKTSLGVVRSRSCTLKSADQSKPIMLNRVSTCHLVDKKDGTVIIMDSCGKLNKALKVRGEGGS